MVLPGRSRHSSRKTILPAGPRVPFLLVIGTLHVDTNQWGDKDEEFVVDQRDLGDVARFNMKLRPKYLGGEHKWNKSQLTEPDGLSEAESDEWEDSLKVYTLFDSVPELVDYVFALDVFYAGSGFQDRSIHDRRVRMLATGNCRAYCARIWFDGGSTHAPALAGWRR